MAEPLPRARFPVDLKEVRPKPRLPSRHRDRSAEANRDSVLLKGQPTEAACSSSPLEVCRPKPAPPCSTQIRQPKPAVPIRRSGSAGRNRRTLLVARGARVNLRHWSGPPAETGGPGEPPAETSGSSRYRCRPEGRPDRRGGSRGRSDPKAGPTSVASLDPEGPLRSISEHLWQNPPGGWREPCAVPEGTALPAAYRPLARGLPSSLAGEHPAPQRQGGKQASHTCRVHPRHRTRGSTWRLRVAFLAHCARPESRASDLRF